MTTTFHGRTILGLTSMAMLLAAQALAQQAPQPRALQDRAGRQVQPGQVIQTQPQQRTAQRPVGARGTQADTEIAAWLILCNEKEAALGQAAAQKAKNENVRQFAQKMAEEHGKVANQLREFAPNTPRLSADQSQQRTAARDGENPDNPKREDQNRPALAQEQNNSRGLPMDRVGAEIAQRSLATCLQELNAKQGEEFDQSFMIGQVMGHQEHWIILETLKKYASPELQSQLQQAVQHTEQHLTQAREICEQLKGSHAKPAEQKTGVQENKEPPVDQSKQ